MNKYMNEIIVSKAKRLPEVVLSHKSVFIGVIMGHEAQERQVRRPCIIQRILNRDLSIG